MNSKYGLDGDKECILCGHGFLKKEKKIFFEKKNMEVGSLAGDFSSFISRNHEMCVHLLLKCYHWGLTDVNEIPEVIIMFCFISVLDPLVSNVAVPQLGRCQRLLLL